jgi:hypothetical protein
MVFASLALLANKTCPWETICSGPFPVYVLKPSHVHRLIVQLRMCVGPKGVYKLSALRLLFLLL